MDAHEEASLREAMNTMYSGLMEAIVSVRNAAELSSIRLEEKIDKIGARLEDKADATVVEALRHDMNRRFDRVDDRFDRVDDRFDRVEGRLDRFEGRLGDVDEKLDGVEQRLERLSPKPKRPKNRD